MPCVAHGSIIQQLTHTDGLPSSAVLSLCASPSGVVWIGTVDGLSTYDSKRFTPYNRRHRGYDLSGNMIHGIYYTDLAQWVQTNYGLDRLNPAGEPIMHFPLFREDGCTFIGDDGRTVLTLTTDNRLYYYTDGKSTDFTWLEGAEIPRNGIKYITWTGDTIRAYSSDGIRTYTVKGGKASFANLQLAPLHNAVRDHDGKMLLLTDGTYILQSYDPVSGATTVLADLSEEVSRRGQITSIARSRSTGDILVGFVWDGVVKLSFTPEGVCKESIDINSGISAIVPDARQEIMWIATDGKGVFKYIESGLQMRSITFNDLKNIIRRPVRSLYLDGANTLWIGTKGDGILRIDNFSLSTPATSLSLRLINSDNSDLLNNEVYSLVPSARNILWIGTEHGLNYYSYKDGSIRRVKVAAEINPQGIHDIYEENDTTLWIAASGKGVIRATVGGPGGSPVITSTKLYTFNNGNRTSNFFFKLAADRRGNIFAANRGHGTFRISPNGMTGITLDETVNRGINDVFAVAVGDSALWIGTAAGIVRKNETSERLFNENNGMPNSTIHDLIMMPNHRLWASTNNGLVCINTTSNSVYTYGHESGIQVTEFSDGAVFTRDDILYFGGIDGIVAVSNHTENGVKPTGYPDIVIDNLQVGNEFAPLSKYFSDSGEKTLVFGANENSITIDISAPDHIKGAHFIYYYSLNNDKSWSIPENNRLSFSHLSPGTHNLRLKYTDASTGYESPVYNIRIKVKQPWYLEWWALVVYSLILLAAIAIFVKMLMKRQAKRQHEEMRELSHIQKEKIYEEKLRFFTSITHEFCTPLTLIYGPCERLLKHNGIDSYGLKYVRLIQSNVERLNALIQEVIDFGRVESGVLQREVTMINISHLCTEAINHFNEMREQNNIKLIPEIQPDLEWPTDYRSFNKIIYNLISNAFKYTPNFGTIRIRLSREDDTLRLCVYNTGKGIRPEDRERIFNSYSILDNLEKNATKGLSSRHGLGMAICHAMVRFLDGNITIDSEVDKYAEFRVTLPLLEITEINSTVSDSKFEAIDTPMLTDQQRLEAANIPKKQKSTPDGTPRHSLLILDDDTDILNLIAEGLYDYDVRTATTPEEALELIHQKLPDAIITDVMMPGTSGIDFTKAIRKDPHLAHVPVILLSAKSASLDKIEGLGAGADAYVAKPFSFNYLEAVVRRLIANRNDLRNYYSSRSSAFDYSDGRLIAKEDKEFIEKIKSIIIEDIASPELSPDFLASKMNMSVRNFYRKLKDLGTASPNDLIKTIRIEYAARLLTTSSTSIQDIIYKCGFNNRSNFYKEFDKHYKMTPRAYREAQQSAAEE